MRKDITNAKHNLVMHTEEIPEQKPNDYSYNINCTYQNYI